jgi:hypothetical protein
VSVCSIALGERDAAGRLTGHFVGGGQPFHMTDWHYDKAAGLITFSLSPDGDRWLEDFYTAAVAKS